MATVTTRGRVFPVSIITLLIQFIALFVVRSAAVRFYLEPGARRCFTEDLPTNARITGELHVASGKGVMEIDLWITTLSGLVIYHNRAADHGKFSFITARVEKMQYSGVDDEEEDGFDFQDETYRICLEHQYRSDAVQPDGAKRSIYFNLHNSFLEIDSEAHNLARSGKTDTLQNNMRNVHDALSNIIGDLSHLQQRERVLVKRLNVTSSRVTYLACLSILIAMITSIMQLQFFKSYFKQRKLC
jgi:hypothetical protein